MLQIAAESRKDVSAYRTLREAVDREAGAINSEWSEPDWTPLRIVARAGARSTMAGYMREARVGLVTPLRDGMNLVAKEFIAAQDPQDPGVLILSRFGLAPPGSSVRQSSSTRTIPTRWQTPSLTRFVCRLLSVRSVGRPVGARSTVRPRCCGGAPSWLRSCALVAVRRRTRPLRLSPHPSSWPRPPDSRLAVMPGLDPGIPRLSAGIKPAVVGPNGLRCPMTS